MYSSLVFTDSCEQQSDSVFRILCLQGLCRKAASRLGELCVADSTAYLGYNESGHQVIATVTRDDCQDGLYCDESNSHCNQERSIGSSCLENRECLDFNCNIESKLCELAPQSIRQLPTWSWGLIALSIPICLVIMVLALYRLHLRHRANRSEEIDQFFSEQWTYRHSILSMHAAAAMASSARSSQIAIQGQDGGSGLQNQDEDDNERVSFHRDRSQDQDQAWASSLHFKGSPTSSLYQSSYTLSPRHVHRRTPSP